MQVIAPPSDLHELYGADILVGRPFKLSYKLATVIWVRHRIGGQRTQITLLQSNAIIAPSGSFNKSAAL